METTIERAPSWSGIGTNVLNCNGNLSEILAKAGLNYNVVSRPVSIDGVGIVPEFKAIVRESDGKVYQIAKQSYEICQNEDAFSLIDALDEDITVQIAGETKSGLIYMIAKMPEQKILGDAFVPNIIFQTSHTSEYGLRMAICPLRVCCQNQFSSAFKNTRNTQTIKHTSSIHSNIEEANQVLMNVSSYMHSFSDEAEALANIQLPVMKAVENLFPLPENASTRVYNNVQERRERFLSIYDSDDNQNFKGTGWGFVNAATDFITHRSAKNGPESHFMSTTINPEMLNKALAVVYNS